MTQKGEHVNEIQVFNNPQFGELRTLEIDGEPWFVGNDVAKALGYEKPRNAIAQHVNEDDALKQGITDSLGRIQEMTIINESGLYSLIFGSKLETAKEFKHWVTSVVLPAIRKHGAYMTPEMIEKVIYDPDLIINLATQLKEEQQKAAVLVDQVAELEPKAERYDDLTNYDGLFTATEIAKDYGMTPYAFNKLLHEHKVQYKVNGIWVPYYAYQKENYLKIIDRKLDDQARVVQQSRWTMKGKEFVYEFFQTLGIQPIHKANEQLRLN